MDARSQLLAQIEADIEHLARAQDALDSRKIEERIDGKLLKMIKGRFQIDIQRCRKDLFTIQGLVRSGNSLDVCWSSFLDINKRSSCLLMQCLDFLEGSLIRSAGMDEDICFVADCLLDELNTISGIQWSAMTIVGDGYYFDLNSGIVRLVFPVNIWSLPFVAHEFGHLLEFVPTDLSNVDMSSVKKLISEERLVSEEEADKEGETTNERYLRELSGDLFGVYSLGPAYALSCIMLICNPLEFFNDLSSHPSWAKRLYFILKALEKMDDSGGYSHVIKEIRSVWEEGLKASGANSQLSKKDLAQLNIWFDNLYRIYEDIMPPGAVYSAINWANAKALIYFWKDRLNNRQHIISQQGLILPQGFERSNMGLRDVLNVAWLCRTKCPNDVGEISEASIKLVKELSVAK